MTTTIAEKPTTMAGAIPMTVKAGESFEIKLNENPTTGYSWALAQLPENFYLLNELYMPEPHKPGMVGTGGVRLFNFVAVKPKIEGDLLFYLLRPWEPLSPTEKKDYHVKVS